MSYVWIIAVMKRSMAWRASVHTTHDCQWLHAGHGNAMCFIIFLCYHKLCHQHWNLLNSSADTSRRRWHTKPLDRTGFYETIRTVYNAFLFTSPNGISIYGLRSRERFMAEILLFIFSGLKRLLLQLYDRYQTHSGWFVSLFARRHVSERCAQKEFFRLVRMKR